MKNTKSFGLGILGLVGGTLFALLLGAFIIEVSNGLFIPFYIWFLIIVPLVTSFCFSIIMLIEVNK